MIQLTAFYIAFSHRHIFLGRPEVPDLNINLDSAIKRGTKWKKEILTAHIAAVLILHTSPGKKPYVLPIKGGRLMVCRGLSNQSLMQACHSWKKKFSRGESCKSTSTQF